MSGDTVCPVCQQRIIAYDLDDQGTWLDPDGHKHIHFKSNARTGGLGTGTEEFLRASDIPDSENQ